MEEHHRKKSFQEEYDELLKNMALRNLFSAKARLGAGAIFPALKDEVRNNLFKASVWCKNETKNNLLCAYDLPCALAQGFKKNNETGL